MDGWDKPTWSTQDFQIKATFLLGKLWGQRREAEENTRRQFLSFDELKTHLLGVFGASLYHPLPLARGRAFGFLGRGFRFCSFSISTHLSSCKGHSGIFAKSQLFGSAVSARQKPLEGIGKPEECLSHFSPAAKEVLWAERDKKAWIQPCTLSFVFARRHADKHPGAASSCSCPEV